MDTVGERFLFEEEDVYRFYPPRSVTTTYRIVSGAVRLYIDGRDYGVRTVGFTVFTEGHSRFEIEVLYPDTVVEVASLQPGKRSDLR